MLAAERPLSTALSGVDLRQVDVHGRWGGATKRTLACTWQRRGDHACELDDEHSQTVMTKKLSLTRRRKSTLNLRADARGSKSL